MKYLFVLIALALVGCDETSYPESNAQAKNSYIKTIGYTRACVDGIVYILYERGISVKYTKEGTVEKCGTFQ